MSVFTTFALSTLTPPLATFTAIVSPLTALADVTFR